MNSLSMPTLINVNTVISQTVSFTLATLPIMCVHAHSCQSCLTLGISRTVAQQCLLSWDSPGKNTGVGSHSLLQGILLIQGLNLCLPYWQAGSFPLASPGKPQVGTIYLGWSDGGRMSSLRNSSSITRHLHSWYSDDQLSAQETCTWMKRKLAVHWEKGRQKSRKASRSQESLKNQSPTEMWGTNGILNFY